MQLTKGSTIIELMVALAIFSFLILVTVNGLIDVSSGSNRGILALNNVDQVKLITSQFVNEMRNASVGIDGSYQLGTVGDNQIIFYSKAPFNGATVNRINYYRSGDKLYKGITVPSGNPQVYNPATEKVVVVQNDVVNSGAVFTYYDGNHDGTTNPFSQPINVNLVKFVKINLTVKNQNKSQPNATFSSNIGATIRNLKNNLGN